MEQKLIDAINDLKNQIAEFMKVNEKLIKSNGYLNSAVNNLSSTIEDKLK